MCLGLGTFAWCGNELKLTLRSLVCCSVVEKLLEVKTMRGIRQCHSLRKHVSIPLKTSSFRSNLFPSTSISTRSLSHNHHSLFSRTFIQPRYASYGLQRNWNVNDNGVNNLFYGVYRRFSDKKPSKKKKSSSSSSSSASKSENEPQGDADAEAKIQHIPRSGGELSTFVVIKEKTQETFSVIYIVGILLVCLPYTIYLVFSSLFSSSGSDKIRNETFDLIREDSRILRILGNDIIAKQATQNVSFVDGDGNERLQIIYQIQGGKGEGRVDVEMLKEGKEYRMQYCIVTTQYSMISIVDNRSLFDRA